MDNMPDIVAFLVRWRAEARQEETLVKTLVSIIQKE